MYDRSGAGGPGVAAAEDERPMGLLEAIILCGGLVVILDGIGAVIGRLNGLDVPVLACLNLFFYIGAGFIAARHYTKANGVWAGVAVAAIDAVLGQLLIAAILPTYRDAPAELIAQIPDGFLIAIIIGAVLATMISVLIGGAICGAIGAALSHAGPFRPRYSYE